jgi:hypothetical protein
VEKQDTNNAADSAADRDSGIDGLQKSRVKLTVLDVDTIVKAIFGNIVLIEDILLQADLLPQDLHDFNIASNRIKVLGAELLRRESYGKPSTSTYPKRVNKKSSRK